MAKKLDPIGVRFDGDIVEDFKEISLLEDRIFSFLIDKACRKFIWDYVFDHPTFAPKSRPLDRNGQDNNGRTQ